MERGEKDFQTVTVAGDRAQPFNIEGVRTISLNNVLTRSGAVTELFRTDWSDISIEPRHVILATMNPGAITDWHRHTRQTDHLIAISGNIKLVLWDGRDSSPTKGKHDIIRLGVLRPLVAVVPPGVWHGLRNESGTIAHYINVNDVPYDHADPDSFRLSSEHGKAPVDL
ncbi:MAG: hypothetical protein BGN84_10265 [Afipia sp. 62-7]|nr:dTDP-4-dehydrorhamnose 3,5-epimerase family protein [Afipia sp.]OJU17543.1 MAG: hypothetical protein BGN84_10265 [Afipia sp. 62-7]